MESRERGFAEMKGKVKEIGIGFLGEFFTELQDGFNDGEADVFKWVQSNLHRYNCIGLPPQQ